MNSHLKVTLDAPLAHLNTFGIKARATALVEVGKPGAVPAAIDLAKRELPSPLLALGDGSNLLFTRDFPGTIIRLTANRIRFDALDSDRPEVIAEGGSNWHRLVLTCAKEGLWGTENLALIPGTCGAAPIQNIGAYGVELHESLSGVEAFHLESGEKRMFETAECQLGYRTSRFREQDEQAYLLTRIHLRLTRTPNPRLSYPGVAERLNDAELSPLAIAHAVAALRQQKLPDPRFEGNAGSFFKNPVIPEDQLAGLLDEWPDLPYFPTPSGQIKLSAAWLIDRAGWRGFRRGGVGVSTKHALVLVNYGNGTGQEILDLSHAIADSVQDRFSVRLHPEPRII